jgi:hypothetical protein
MNLQHLREQEVYLSFRVLCCHKTETIATPAMVQDKLRFPPGPIRANE